MKLSYSDRTYISTVYMERIGIWMKAANNAVAVGQYLLGRCHELGLGVDESDEQAKALFQKAAEQGEVNAQYALGYYYEESPLSTRDYNEAAKWYRKAAQQGHCDAQYRLGCLCKRIQAVAKDALEAGRWISKAAEQGHRDAMRRCWSFPEEVYTEFRRGSYFLGKDVAEGDPGPESESRQPGVVDSANATAKRSISPKRQ